MKKEIQMTGEINVPEWTGGDVNIGGSFRHNDEVRERQPSANENNCDGNGASLD